MVTKSSAFYYLGDQMYFSDSYRVIINGYGNGAQNPSHTVFANLQSELSFGGGNNFDGRGEAIRNLAQKVPGGSTVYNLREVANNAGSAFGGASKFMTQFESEATWQGSQKPQINLDLTFVCLDSQKPSEDVVDRVNTLMRFVMPDIDSGRLVPPLGYNVSTSNSGKISVQVGIGLSKWFEADKLICTSCNFTYSKELNYQGRPIYANGTITLEPFRTIGYSEFIGWFRT